MNSVWFSATGEFQIFSQTIINRKGFCCAFEFIDTHACIGSEGAGNAFAKAFNMYTDLDESESSDNEETKEDGGAVAGEQAEEKAPSVASSVKTHSDSELSGFTSDDSDFSGDRGNASTSAAATKAEKEKKEAELGPPPKSTTKKIHEFFHGPEIIIDWFARLDSAACGVKARDPICPGMVMEPIVWMEIDASLKPGTQVKFVCPHSEGPQKLRFADVGESCDVCIEMAERRLRSFVGGRFHLYKDEESIEFKQFNTACYWNELGVAWEDTFRVEPWDFVEARLVEKFLFGEHSLVCLAFEEQLFWNVVKYFSESRNPDKTVARASEWHQACKYSRPEHRKIKHFSDELKDLKEQHRIEMRGRTTPLLVVETMQKVFCFDDEYQEFAKRISEGEDRDGNLMEMDRRGANCWAPMHIAAIKNEFKLIDPLLKKGAMLSPKDSAGYTPLHYAAMYGMQDAALLLIKHGADIYETNREGNDAIQIALNMRHKELALKMAKTKKLYNDTIRRVNEFYELLMAGDATVYDPRYGAGEHVTLGWKNGTRDISNAMFLYKFLSLAVVKKRRWFHSKAAKSFSVLSFYSFPDLIQMAMKTLKCKKEKDVKNLVYRFDPVGNKKHYERVLKPVAKRVFKKSAETGKKMQPKELYDRLMAGQRNYKRWAEANTSPVRVQYELEQSKILQKKKQEKERLEELEGKKKGKKKK